MTIFGMLYSIQIKRHEVCSKSVLSLFKVRNDSLDSLQESTIEGSRLGVLFCTSSFWMNSAQCLFFLCGFDVRKVVSQVVKLFYSFDGGSVAFHPS